VLQLIQIHTEQVGSGGNAFNLIQEATGSNLGLDSAYPDKSFPWFLRGALNI
jgi:hypothetical protein